jgi:hypothetical protein
VLQLAFLEVVDPVDQVLGDVEVHDAGAAGVGRAEGVTEELADPVARRDVRGPLRHR